jgi:hypothetical protein
MSVKSYTRIVPVAAFVVLAVFAISRCFAAASGQEGEASVRNGEAVAQSLTLGYTTRGVVFKTAAINADASVANCFRCNKTNTLHLGTGLYQVGFDENVQATNGWSRWVQVDTLSTGSINNVSCSTADRAGLTTGVWVECYNGSGTNVDTSFFIFVAR